MSNKDIKDARYGRTLELDAVINYVRMEKEKLEPEDPLLFQDFMRILNGIECRLKRLRLP